MTIQDSMAWRCKEPCLCFGIVQTSREILGGIIANKACTFPPRSCKACKMKYQVHLALRIDQAGELLGLLERTAAAAVSIFNKLSPTGRASRPGLPGRAKPASKYRLDALRVELESGARARETGPVAPAGSLVTLVSALSVVQRSRTCLESWKDALLLRLLWPSSVSSGFLVEAGAAGGSATSTAFSSQYGYVATRYGCLMLAPGRSC